MFVFWNFAIRADLTRSKLIRDPRLRDKISHARVLGRKTLTRVILHEFVYDGSCYVASTLGPFFLVSSPLYKPRSKL